VNMMEILCTHACKRKNESHWNCSRNGGGGRMMKEWMQLWYIVRNVVNVTMYPHYNDNYQKRFKKYHWTIHLIQGKMVNFILCIYYRNKKVF
jgi:hypothetical protein